jgi:hypothetical protein
VLDVGPLHQSGLPAQAAHGLDAIDHPPECCGLDRPAADACGATLQHPPWVDIGIEWASFPIEALR